MHRWRFLPLSTHGLLKDWYIANTVSAVRYLGEIQGPNFRKKDFPTVDESSTLFENVEMSKELVNSYFGCDYGCGIFILKNTMESHIVLISKN